MRGSAYEKARHPHSCRGAARGALLGAPALAADGEDGAEESSTIDFLSYEEAVTYFDFDTAASNWCTNFGMDPTVSLEEAKAAILHGTDRELVIRLATFARDVGYGDEKAHRDECLPPGVLSGGHRPARLNANTGPFRRALLWNGRSVTNFWWDAETAPGWPEDYAIDLSAYDIQTLDLRYYYRAALRLWDNTWANGYYARPGCSGHNSGNAMDISNYWLGANFKTSYANPKTGVVYHMADYGLYKPLQPSATTAGETWHITSSQEVLALGNYDNALLSGYEIVYALYYNPSLRGWSMADGRGVYIGAGVTVLQIELCRRGLLEEKIHHRLLLLQNRRGRARLPVAAGTRVGRHRGQWHGQRLAQRRAAHRRHGRARADGLDHRRGDLQRLLALPLRHGREGLNAFRVDTRGEGDDGGSRATTTSPSPAPARSTWTSGGRAIMRCAPPRATRTETKARLPTSARCSSIRQAPSSARSRSPTSPKPASRCTTASPITARSRG